MVDSSSKLGLPLHASGMAPRITQLKESMDLKKPGGHYFNTIKSDLKAQGRTAIMRLVNTISISAYQRIKALASFKSPSFININS